MSEQPKVSESLLDFLHGTVVKQFSGQDEKLELMGFRVGFQLVERFPICSVS